MGRRTNLVRHEGSDGAPQLVIVSAGVAGPKHHEKEANRHGDLKHRLQEHRLTQPHKGCRWLLQERHTAWGETARGAGHRGAGKAARSGCLRNIMCNGAGVH